MFDLEKAIAEWREEMRAGGCDSAETMAELESHLREDLRAEMRLGLDAESAFAAARRNLGNGAELKAEFAAAGVLEKARRLRRFHLVAGGAAVMGALALAWFLIVGRRFEGIDRVVGLADLGLAAGIVLGWRRLCRVLPVIRSQRARRGIGLGLALVGNMAVVLFFNLSLPHLELSEGRLTVLVLWVMTLLVITGSLWHGLDEAARLRATQTDS